MYFSPNVGSIDQAARLLLGVLLVLLALTGTIGVWGWLGLVFIVTGFVRFCPIYRVLGMCTCQKDEQ